MSFAPDKNSKGAFLIVTIRIRLTEIDHLPSIARELGMEIKPEKFDEIHRKIPYILNVRPSGEFPGEYFWYAGGVPGVMEEIKDFLHLDVLTVTGKTLGENLKDLKNSDYYEQCYKELEERGFKKEDIIKTKENPINKEGGIGILKGNLAPEGAVVKHSALAKEMMEATLIALPFDSEEEAIEAVLSKKKKPGDGVFIRYEGPKGSGMPEMFYTTEAIASDPELVSTTALKPKYTKGALGVYTKLAVSPMKGGYME